MHKATIRSFGLALAAGALLAGAPLQADDSCGAFYQICNARGYSTDNASCSSGSYAWWNDTCSWDKKKKDRWLKELGDKELTGVVVEGAERDDDGAAGNLLFVLADDTLYLLEDFSAEEERDHGGKGKGGDGDGGGGDGDGGGGDGDGDGDGGGGGGTPPLEINCSFYVCLEEADKKASCGLVIMEAPCPASEDCLSEEGQDACGVTTGPVDLAALFKPFAED